MSTQPGDSCYFMMPSSIVIAAAPLGITISTWHYRGFHPLPAIRSGEATGGCPSAVVMNRPIDQGHERGPGNVKSSVFPGTQESSHPKSANKKYDQDARAEQDITGRNFWVS
jgi:hypothetical protein